MKNINTTPNMIFDCPVRELPSYRTWPLIACCNIHNLSVYFDFLKFKVSVPNRVKEDIPFTKLIVGHSHSHSYTLIFISDLDNSAILHDKIPLWLIRVKHTESFCSGEETSTATPAESVQVEEDDGAEDTEDGGGWCDDQSNREGFYCNQLVWIPYQTSNYSGDTDGDVY